MGGPEAPQALANMQRLCFANDRELEEANTELFPSLGGPPGPEEPPQQSSGIRLWGTKVATIQNPCIFTVPRGLMGEGRTVPQKQLLSQQRF